MSKLSEINSFGSYLINKSTYGIFQSWKKVNFLSDNNLLPGTVFGKSMKNDRKITHKTKYKLQIVEENIIRVSH